MEAFFVFSPKPPTSVGGYHQLGFACIFVCMACQLEVDSAMQ